MSATTEKQTLQNIVPISDVRPGRAVTVIGKVAVIQQAVHHSITQKGIITDATGAVQYAEFGSAAALIFRIGEWYKFENVLGNQYLGATVLNITPFSIVTPLTKEEVPDFELPAPTPLSERKLGVIPAIRAKFVSEWESRSPNIYQIGVLADETAGIKFILWNDKSNPNQPRLIQGKVYTVYYPIVNVSDGHEALNIHSGVWVQEDTDIEACMTALQTVPTTTKSNVTVTGFVTTILPGSGLIYRCPVPKCGRRLTVGNICSNHDYQESPISDLRIKAVLDDGQTAYTVVIPRAVTEKLTGLTMAGAADISARDPRHEEAVRVKLDQMVGGRYLKCTGTMLGEYLIATDAEITEYVPDSSAKTLMEIMALKQSLTAVDPVINEDVSE